MSDLAALFDRDQEALRCPYPIFDELRADAPVVYDDSLGAVRQALDTYGGLHAVVNNAGINRDRMFASMTEADWDAIMAAHLKGHFCIQHFVKKGR